MDFIKSVKKAHNQNRIEDDMLAKIMQIVEDNPGGQNYEWGYGLGGKAFLVIEDLMAKKYRFGIKERLSKAGISFYPVR